MKNAMVFVMGTLFVVGCASNENLVREAVKKNPQIVFDAIEENPERFIEVVNRVAQKAQQKHYEKQAAELQGQQEKDLKNPRSPQLRSDRRLIGKGSEKIVIVEYGDFQCPACGMGYKALKELKKKYHGQVQFYFKNMPLDFHKMAYPAAVYFEAVRLQSPEKALKFYSELFENQSELSENFLKKTAGKVGVDLKKLALDIKSEKIRDLVAEDIKEFEAFGFTGTPVTLINGVVLKGAQQFEQLERIAKLTSENSSR